CELQYFGEIRGGRITNGQRIQAPTPLNHLQNRCVIEDAVRDMLTWSKRRDDQTRRPKPEQPILITCSLIGGRNWSGWRRHVIEKAAPFVVVDDQDRVRPGRTAGDRRIHLIQQCLAVANVSEWMVVIRYALLFAKKPWVHERDVRQSSCRSIGEERGESMRDRRVPGS